MRICVLSDIHGNGRALDVAIREIAKCAPDQVIILGDLLTYGPDVNTVLDAVESLSQQQPTRWILGNHEELYFDLNRGMTEYVDGLPQWIQDSIRWTFERADMDRLASFPWERDCELQSILFSHANPWRSWRYLQQDADYLEAAETLRHRGLVAGIFGHTHRSRLFFHRTHDGDSLRVSSDSSHAAVVNAGSVGQPRNDTAVSTILSIVVEDQHVEFSLVPLSYDVPGHLATLNALNLPHSTRERLSSFFRPHQ